MFLFFNKNFGEEAKVNFGDTVYIIVNSTSFNERYCKEVEVQEVWFRDDCSGVTSFGDKYTYGVNLFMDKLEGQLVADWMNKVGFEREVRKIAVELYRYLGKDCKITCNVLKDMASVHIGDNEMVLVFIFEESSIKYASTVKVGSKIDHKMISDYVDSIINKN